MADGEGSRSLGRCRVSFCMAGALTKTSRAEVAVNGSATRCGTRRRRRRSSRSAWRSGAMHGTWAVRCACCSRRCTCCRACPCCRGGVLVSARVSCHLDGADGGAARGSPREGPWGAPAVSSTAGSMKTATTAANTSESASDVRWRIVALAALMRLTLLARSGRRRILSSRAALCNESMCGAVVANASTSCDGKSINSRRGRWSASVLPDMERTTSSSCETSWIQSLRWPLRRTIGGAIDATSEPVCNGEPLGARGA
mmetsp:Transcript_42862/g.121148  ORF Transcript_42862/g.121148 Transcript_42862/m.121148 type:complete len:257 (-) Transcript_42862:48-818(-)